MTRGEFAMRNWILIGGCIQDFVYYETRVEFFTFSSCFFFIFIFVLLQSVRIRFHFHVFLRVRWFSFDPSAPELEGGKKI